MKIAIFVDVFPIASQTFVLNQITTLIDLGVDVEILALYPGDQIVLSQPSLAPYQLQRNVTYLLAPKRTVWQQLGHRLSKVGKGLILGKNRRTILAGLKPEFSAQARNLMLSTIAATHSAPLKFDWVIAHFGSSGVVANNLRQIGVLEANIATVFHGQDITAELKFKHTQQNYQRLFKETELLLPVSELWKTQLLSMGADESKTYVQRMGVDLSLFMARRTDKSTKVLHILTVARFSQKKGLKYALQALAKLPSTMQFSYRLVGYGELEEELKAQSSALGLNDKVHFLGAMNTQQVAEQMRWADVFLQPSITADNGDKEGVPVSIMEAMASGAVIVSTLHSGIPELVAHNVNGLLAPEKDADALAQHLNSLYLKPDLRLELADNARERVSALADVVKLNQQLLDLMSNYKRYH
ncbi:glycosyltransferase [Pseudoalteromonas sp. A25]|uniref:glycosyltransferase n=1 Tax=Pseudoalteromonas sp. A25 TaxID=116092 RepID=UPI00126052FC|nr:glycosyltransferase [Pseudoalteromonas sp. A25]